MSTTIVGVESHTTILCLAGVAGVCDSRSLVGGRRYARAVQMGNLAEWIGAIGTVGALVLGLALLGRELAISRRKGADDFITWVTRDEVLIPGAGIKQITVVHASNTGARPVKTPLIAYADIRGGFSTQVLSPNGMSGVLTPGTEVAITVKESRQTKLPIYVFLQDSSGRQWLRYADEHRYPNWFVSSLLYVMLIFFERPDGATARKVRARERAAASPLRISRPDPWRTAPANDQRDL
ncbi:hypothetical protein ACWEOH_05620 [Agromyces sp. NPDC004153]